MKKIEYDGRKVKIAVVASGFTKEKVVTFVQDKGFRFSLAGLDKIFRNEFPKKDTETILGIIAENCRCDLIDLAES